MIEKFEIIQSEKGERWNTYFFKFILGEELFYSCYSVSISSSHISLSLGYCSNLNLETATGIFSNELKEELKTFILKQKEIRLRHLVNPYKIN